MYLVGGMSIGSKYADLWSSVASAAFTPRDALAGAVHDGQLMIVGGKQGSSSNNANDVWSSDDGVTWRRGHRTVITF